MFLIECTKYRQLSSALNVDYYHRMRYCAKGRSSSALNVDYYRGMRYCAKGRSMSDIPQPCVTTTGCWQLQQEVLLMGITKYYLHY